MHCIEWFVVLLRHNLIQYTWILFLLTHKQRQPMHQLKLAIHSLRGSGPLCTKAVLLETRQNTPTKNKKGRLGNGPETKLELPLSGYNVMLLTGKVL